MVFPKKSKKNEPEAGVIDATPDTAPPDKPPLKDRPRNIVETEVWKESTGTLKRAWSSYLNMLSERFQAMPRASQEELIGKVSLIFTMGAAVIILVMFYAFLPTLVRLLFLPAALGGAYLVGRKIVTPIMVDRYDKYLNREF